MSSVQPQGQDTKQVAPTTPQRSRSPGPAHLERTFAAPFHARRFCRLGCWAPEQVTRIVWPCCLRWGPLPHTPKLCGWCQSAAQHPLRKARCAQARCLLHAAAAGEVLAGRGKHHTRPHRVGDSRPTNNRRGLVPWGTLSQDTKCGPSTHTAALPWCCMAALTRLSQPMSAQTFVLYMLCRHPGVRAYKPKHPWLCSWLEQCRKLIHAACMPARQKSARFGTDIATSTSSRGPPARRPSCLTTSSKHTRIQLLSSVPEAARPGCTGVVGPPRGAPSTRNLCEQEAQ